MPELVAYGKSVYSLTGAPTDPTNLLGAPDGNLASVVSSTSSYIGVRVDFDLSALPLDATVDSFVFGGRLSSSTTAGDINLSLRKADASSLDSWIFDPAATLTDYDRTYGAAITAADVRGATLAWSARSASSTVKSSYADALWLKVVYHGGTSAARGKRWDGSAWVDLAPKRWDGSAWVPAASKRYDGAGWV